MCIFFRKLITIAASAAAMLFPLSLAAQNLWIFSPNHTASFKQSWTQGHILPVTHAGEGVIRAVDAQGNDLLRYEVKKDRAIAGPFKAGDCYLFEVPSASLPEGSFVDFNMTFAIEDGAPMDWILEVKDGRRWREGKTFRCYGPAFEKQYRFTTVCQTFRLDFPLEDKIEFRVRALDGLVRPSKGAEKEGGAMFAAGSYLGVMINDFGVEAPKDTLKVLAIGNSFTYYCGTPVMLKDIAWKEGHFIDISTSLKGGWTMAQHLSLETTNDLVAEGGYDYMILQDQSQAPAKVGKDPKGKAQLVKEMEAMATKVRTNSPECKAVVECTWAYFKNDFGGFGSMEAFDKYGRRGARIMAKAVEDAVVSPISQAYEIVRKERPDINLYHTDKHHQSYLGSYLKSCVNYLVLYGEPFGASPADCLIEPQTAAYLRSVAEKVVLK